MINCITNKNNTTKTDSLKKYRSFFSTVGKISFAKKVMFFWMDGWRDGWMIQLMDDGWMDIRMKGWTNGYGS